jgi:hypothetical protein
VHQPNSGEADEIDGVFSEQLKVMSGIKMDIERDRRAKDNPFSVNKGFIFKERSVYQWAITDTHKLIPKYTDTHKKLERTKDKMNYKILMFEEKISRDKISSFSLQSCLLLAI